MTQWIDPHLTESLANTLLHSLWQGPLILLLVFGLQRANIFIDVKQRYLLHLGGMIMLFAASLLTFFATFEMRALPRDFEVAQIVTDAFLPFIRPEQFQWEQVLIVVWLTGAFIFLLKNLLAATHLYQLYSQSDFAPLDWQQRLSQLKSKLGIRRKVVLLKATGNCQVPFVLGLFRSSIIFPAIYFNQLTPEEFESILIHELAHIRRHDFLINIVQVLLETIFFFNPAIWILSRQARRYREYCCDEVVQNSIPNKKIYLLALHHAARISFDQPTTMVALAQNNSELIYRIKRMLNMSINVVQFRPIVIIALFVSLLFCVAFTLGPVAESPLVHTTEMNGRLSDHWAGQNESNDSEESNLSMNRFPDQLEPELTIAHSNIVTLNPNPVRTNKESAPSTLSGERKRDTIPPVAKIEELEKQLHEDASEMEELALQAQEEIELHLAQEAERLEAVSLQFEAERARQWAQIEAQNAEEMEQIEARIAKQAAEMANQQGNLAAESAARLQLGKELERKWAHHPMYRDTPPETRELLQQEMEMLRLQMQEEMNAIHEQRWELLQPVQDEIRQAMTELRSEFHEARSAERKALQEAMQSQRQALQEQLRTFHDTKTEMQRAIREEMHEKALELHELKKELHHQKLRQTDVEKNKEIKEKEEKVKSKQKRKEKEKKQK